LLLTDLPGPAARIGIPTVTQVDFVAERRDAET